MQRQSPTPVACDSVSAKSVAGMHVSARLTTEHLALEVRHPPACMNYTHCIRGGVTVHFIFSPQERHIRYDSRSYLKDRSGSRPLIGPLVKT
ncbi:hypothetical protein EVAR_13292_1 [Eumeta japonica]|uniref:Uncharacterized protein n=1 Tax=Eumeta variegata TaxID=151549 RepID=A0A4C1TRP9_EUMVA|nr:hypothetical protein EVAR_13292_1 [Eumeta japonica]